MEICVLKLFCMKKEKYSFLPSKDLTYKYLKNEREELLRDFIFMSKLDFCKSLDFSFVLWLKGCLTIKNAPDIILKITGIFPLLGNSSCPTEVKPCTLLKKDRTQWMIKNAQL